MAQDPKEHFNGMTLVRTLGVQTNQWGVYLDVGANQPGCLIGEVVFDPDGRESGSPRTWLALDLAGHTLTDSYKCRRIFGSQREAAEALKHAMLQS